MTNIKRVRVKLQLFVNLSQHTRTRPKQILKESEISRTFLALDAGQIEFRMHMFSFKIEVS